MLSAIDHVGVAVPDIDAALGFYRDALQMELVHRETVVDQGVKAALLDVGDSHVELIEPLSPDSGVGRFLTSTAQACITSPTGSNRSTRR